MENYEKGEVKEVEEPPVFPMADKDVLMRVSGGSKIRNLMGYALKKMKEPEVRQMCWAGSGKAITKTVSSAEIMKRKIKGLHQITKIRYRRVEEYWEPKVEGLERLKVNRDIPAIAILLSKDPLDKNEPGYQSPGSFDEFWRDVTAKDKKVTGNSKRQMLLDNSKSDNNKRRKRPRPGKNSRMQRDNNSPQKSNDNVGDSNNSVKEEMDTGP